MKYLMTVTIGLLTALFLQAQVVAPALSPRSTISQKIGLSKMEIDYTRPSVRGRTVMGENGLIPYGELWRTGANVVTKLTFGDAIQINNQDLAKGSYAVLSTLEAETWTLHFYPYEKQSWSKFKAKTPILSITAERQVTAALVETFYIGYENIQLDKANLVLSWENTRIEIPVVASAKEKMLKSIQKTMAGPSNNDYFQAALYLHEANINLEEALGYIQKVTQSEKALFFQVYREALILRDLNRREEALKAAKRSKVLAQKAKNMDFVRLNDKLIEALQE